jgi:hypothetical protein
LIKLIFPDREAPETSDFNPAAILERIDETLKNHINDLECILGREVFGGGRVL